MIKDKVLYILLFIFLFAIILRFLYFPKDIYFGIDQALGSFAVKEILEGHPKIVGPPTTFPGLRHGVLYYYLYTPFYWLGGGDPSLAAAFLRVANALGVFLIFIVGAILFNKYVGIIASLLFAISFEQTQFALYFNHPSLAVISVLIMFLGLSILIFKKSKIGFIIALLGLGLSIQLEFILTYLIVPFLITLICFRKSFPNINLKIFVSGLFIFLLTISSFIAAELKFNFRSVHLLPKLLFSGEPKSLVKIISTYVFEIGQIIKFNLTGSSEFAPFAGIILLVLLILLSISKIKRQAFFLQIWFFSLLIIYIVGGGESLNVDVLQYHGNAGVSSSLIIFVSYLLWRLGKKIKFLAFLVVILIIIANFRLIEKINPYGTMPQLNAQSFMLLSDEIKVLDYIYQDANNKSFAVKAISLPFYINSTWSYLFEWYGNKKYGYLPIWGGKNASGYPGNLLVEDAQDKLPDKRYLIIEPTRGIPEHLINDYLREENYFSDSIQEKEIGRFKVQVRFRK